MQQTWRAGRAAALTAQRYRHLMLMVVARFCIAELTRIIQGLTGAISVTYAHVPSKVSRLVTGRQTNRGTCAVDVSNE